MKNSTKDQVQGKLHQVKGTLKEKAGQIINSPGLEAEGQMEKTAGKVQQKVGQIEEVLDARSVHLGMGGEIVRVDGLDERQGVVLRPELSSALSLTTRSAVVVKDSFILLSRITGAKDCLYALKNPKDKVFSSIIGLIRVSFLLCCPNLHAPRGHHEG